MKKSRFITIVCICLVAYGSFRYMDQKDVDTGQSPVFHIPESTLKVSVKAKEKDLLAGIVVTDYEDGDISGKAFVESISPFDENKERTVTYAVFDKDDHIARGTRKIKYKDYKAPKFDIIQPLTLVYYGNQNYFLNHVTAYSPVDGNITSNISFDFHLNEKGISTVEYKVSDSCGTESSIKLNVSDLALNATVDIELSDYIIYVPKGKQIEPLDYVESIKIAGMESNELIDKISVHSDYNPDKKGMYEIIYKINQGNGEFGATKLVVIVQ